MKFSFVSIFPDLIEQNLLSGIVGQSFKSGRLTKEIVNPRSHTTDVHKSVDDRPFGGGDGMVMLAEPMAQSVEQILAQNEDKPLVIYMSPQGQMLNQQMVQKLTQYPHLLFICGRYGGIDQRFLNKYVDVEISIGDYVLSGGEVPALVVVDAVSRQLPGVLGHGASAHSDSFLGEWGGLEAPQFTRPRFWQNEGVPEVYLGGNHVLQSKVQKALSLAVTLIKRPELVEQAFLSNKLSSVDFNAAIKDLKEIAETEWSSLGIPKEEVLKRLTIWKNKTQVLR